MNFDKFGQKLNQFLYGHRDPDEAVRRANAKVRQEWATIENHRETMEETDRRLGITKFNGRGPGQPIRWHRSWRQRWRSP
jgi:hypothetical protein